MELFWLKPQEEEAGVGDGWFHQDGRLYLPNPKVPEAPVQKFGALGFTWKNQ